MPILYENGPTMTGGGSAGGGGKAGGSTNAGAGTASGTTSAGVKLGGKVNAGPKPTKKAPKAKNTNNNSPARQDALNRRANGGGSNNGGGGSAKPAKPATPAPKPKPTPTLPTFDQWAMKDSAYQQALADYNLQIANSQNTRDTNISAANQDRELQLGDWQTQYDRGAQGLLDDFAARGLGNSGLYADAQQKYVSDSEAQKQSIMDAILRRIQGADSTLTGEKTAADQALQQAKLEAARRGAGQFSGTV